jgi:uncharacterized protein (DUF2164 family)
MKRQSVFISCLIFPFLILCFQFSPAQSAKKRQVNLYDNGGNFDFNWGIEHEERQQMKTKLRDFLQTRWNQKRLGKVTAAFYTMEGDPLISNFYIEADKKGRWIIIEKWERTCCALYQLEKKKRKRVTTKGTKIYKTTEDIETLLEEVIPF